MSTDNVPFSKVVEANANNKFAKSLITLERMIKRGMKTGELVFISASKSEQTQPVGCFNSAAYRTETNFGLGILSSDDVENVRWKFLDLIFPTGDRCACIDLGSRKASVVDINLSVGFVSGDHYFDLRDLRREIPDHFAEGARMVEIRVGTEAVEKLFARNSYFRSFSEEFDLLCQALDYKNCRMRTEEDKKLAEARKTLLSEFAGLPDHISSLMDRADELGVGNEPVVAMWRGLLKG